MPVLSFDHVAIPTSKPDELMHFYRALGFTVPTPEEWRASGKPFFTIQFGDNKINVHGPDLWQGGKFTLRGPTAQPGCGDFCFVWSGSVDEIHAMLRKANAEVTEGPVERVGGKSGGTATGTSVYTRDPEGNLLEFIVY